MGLGKKDLSEMFELNMIEVFVKMDKNKVFYILLI